MRNSNPSLIQSFLTAFPEQLLTLFYSIQGGLCVENYCCIIWCLVQLTHMAQAENVCKCNKNFKQYSRDNLSYDHYSHLGDS